jgi:ferredoxin
MRVVVDLSQCESNALCMAAAPDVFQLDDDDQLHVLVEHPAPEQLENVERAIRTCPKQAISLVES